MIQNGKHNEITVITYVIAPITMGYKENKACRCGKKEGVANVLWRVSHEMNIEESSIWHTIGDQLKLTK